MKRIIVIAMLGLWLMIPSVSADLRDHNRDVRKAKGELRRTLEKFTRARGLSLYELALVQQARSREITPGDEASEIESLRDSLVEKIREYEPDYMSPMEIEFEKKRKARKTVTKLYDVGDIVSAPPNFKSPLMGLGDIFRRYPTSLGTGSAGGGGRAILELNGDEEGDGAPSFSPDALIELASNLMDSEYDDENVEILNNKLVARFTKDGHKKLKKLLDTLRPHTTRATSLDVRLVKMTPGFYRKLQAANKTHGGMILSEDALKMLEAAITTGKEVTAHAEGHILAQNCQTVSLQEGGQMSLLMDYSVSLSGPAPIISANVRVVHEGLLAELTPMITRDDKAVIVDVSTCFGKIKQPIKKITIKYGDMHQPEMDISKIVSTLRIPTGATAFVGGVSSTKDGDKWGNELMLLVKATIVRKSEREVEK